MPTSIFDSAAKWVQKRQPANVSPLPTGEDLCHAFLGLQTASKKCCISVMVPNLFPGSDVEVIHIPAEAGTTLIPASVSNVVHPFPASALAAIGTALHLEMTNSGSEMVAYDDDDGSRTIAYLPHVRSTVLQALGLVLLSE